MSRVADALSELATQKIEELRHERDTARQEAADLRAALSEMWDTACTNATSTPSKAAFLKAHAVLSARSSDGVVKIEGV